MKNKILDIIDKLLKLSSDTYNDGYKDKQEFLEENIKDINIKIKNLEKKIENNNYVDNDLFIMDQGLVSAISKNIKKLDNNINYEKDNLAEIIKEKNFLNERLELSTDNFYKYKELIKNINYKLSDNKSNINYFNELLKRGELKLNYWKNDIKECEYKLSVVFNKENSVKARKENYEYERKNNKDKLNEVKSNLENELYYFDHSLKDKDEKKIVKLKEDLKNYNEKLSLLNNDLIINYDSFKEYVLNDDYENATFEFKAFIKKMKDIPFAVDNDYVKLESLLKNLKKEKNEINNRIKKNDYLSVSSKVYSARLNDLNHLLEDNKKDILEINKIITNLDKNRSFNLVTKITDLEVNEELLANYNSDLNHVIEYSVILKNTSLKYLESYKKRLLNEIEFIANKLSKKIDLIDENKKVRDINRIKKIGLDIAYIENRLENRIDINKLSDEVLMMLRSIDLTESTTNYIKVKNITHLDMQDESYIIDLTGV